MLNRLPFIASEIFNCELNKINDIFFIARPIEQEFKNNKGHDS